MHLQIVADKKDNLPKLLTALKDSDITNIDDDDLEDPQSCSLYAADIYDTMRVAEVCAISIMRFVCSSHLFYNTVIFSVNSACFESKKLSNFFCHPL